MSRVTQNPVVYLALSPGLRPHSARMPSAVATAKG